MAVATKTKIRTKPATQVKARRPSANGRVEGGAHRIASQSEAAKKLRQEVIDRADRHQVQVVALWFTDILGQLKSFVVPRHALEEALEEGLGFDGSSVEGFARIFESDLLAVPDPRTFAILPFQVDGQVACRFICDIHHPDGRPYQGDPRWVLKKNLAKIEAKGMTMYTGPELEYFYVKSPTDPTLLGPGRLLRHDRRRPRHRAAPETMAAMASMGTIVECGHHEVAPSQHEIDMRYTDALTMAVRVMTFRYAGARDRAAAQRARDVHAEAHLRHQRLRHARAPVDLRTAGTSCTKRARRSTLSKFARAYTRRRAQACARAGRGHEPVGELVQAARARLRRRPRAWRGARRIARRSSACRCTSRGTRRRHASRSASRIPRRIPPRVRGAARGGHGRRQRQVRPARAARGGRVPPRRRPAQEAERRNCRARSTRPAS